MGGARRDQREEIRRGLGSTAERQGTGGAVQGAIGPRPATSWPSPTRQALGKAKECTDGSGVVLGDQRPQYRWAIVERHEEMADGRLEGGLAESFGVLVAPAGFADAAGYDGHRGLDDPFISGGTVHAGRAVDDGRRVNLDLGASDGGEGSDACFEGWDDGLDFGQSVPKMEANRTGSSAYMVEMSFMYNPRNF